MNNGLAPLAQSACDIKKIIEKFGSIPNTIESINAIEKITNAPAMIKTMVSCGQLIMTKKSILP